MKAMILAAGLGNRMRPLTLTTPKPLLEVGGKPLIVWHIEALKKIGITEIVINAAWLKDKLVKVLADGSQFGVTITWSLEDEGLETAGGIIQALPYLGAEPFILINGDVWTRFDFSDLLEIDLEEKLAHLILVENPTQHPKGDFLLANDQVYTLDQSIMGEALTFSGISVLSPKLFAGLEVGKRALLPVFLSAISDERISGQKMSSAWVDVGTPERLNELDEKIKNHLI